MNKIIYCDDIQSILNEFIFDMKTILAWRHTCKRNMKKKYYVTIGTINVEQAFNSYNNIFKRGNKLYIHDIFNVIQISSLPYYFDDSYIINFNYLLCLNCAFTNKITDESIQHLHNISMLLCNNVLTDKSICKLVNLRLLDMKDNSYITDKSLIYLTKLTELYINELCIDISDKSISQMTNLTKLYLGFNKTCRITNDSINKLCNLTYLNINDNQFIDYINLPSLKTLYANQKLQDSSIFCTNLTHLFCNDNENFTDNLLCKLPNLLLLNCGYNTNFTDISLHQLSNLTYLDCGFNSSFTNNGLSSLSKLNTLYCGFNLNFTNHGLLNLKNIIMLNCGANNNFTARGIINLINLEELVCHYGKSNVNIIDLKPLRKLKKVNGINFRR